MTQVQGFERSVMCVLNVEGTVTGGTSFVIANRLVVTYAYVVEAARSSCGQALGPIFPQQHFTGCPCTL